MAMSRSEKQEAITFLEERLSSAKAGLVFGFKGLTVAQVDEVRATFRECEVEYKVVKNTLMRRALDGSEIAALGDAFVGPTAVAFKFDDEAGKLGKAAKELAKKFEKLEVKAGYVGDDILTGDVVETMASIPTLDEARAQLLGVINAPASKLLAQINAPAQHVVGVIQAKVDKDKEAA